MLRSCGVVGHHPTRFKWKYQENNTGCKRLKKRMRDQLELLYQQGIRWFYIGAGLGVDLWAGEILLRMKEQEAYQDLEIVVVLPFEGHDRNWDSHSRERLSFLKRHSARTVVLGTSATKQVAYDCAAVYIAERADCLLAVYDGVQSGKGTVGTAVYRGEQRNIPIIRIHPDTAVVTGGDFS